MKNKRREFGFTVTSGEYFKDSAMPVIIKRENSGGEVTSHPVHKHEFTELVIITSGTAVHQTENGLIPLAKGDVFVIHKGHTHGYVEIKNMSLINILFHAKRLPLPMADFGASDFASVLFNHDHPADTLMNLSGETLDKITGFIREIDRENESRPSSYIFRGIAVFMLLLAELERNYTAAPVREIRADVIADAVEFMEKHYSGKIDFDQMAKMLGVSRRSFFREFIRHTNTSPHKYLIGIRLRYAIELLKNPANSPAEVAVWCGFGTPAVLNYHFVNSFGKSIREVYGRRHK